METPDNLCLEVLQAVELLVTEYGYTQHDINAVVEEAMANAADATANSEGK